MSREMQVLIGIVVGTMVIIIAAAIFMSGSGKSPLAPTNEAPVAADILVKEDSWTEGPKDAKVTVVEFADFECPACKVAEPTVKQIREKYKDKILYVYRFFPLPSHQYGIISAQAGEAAGRQGKFWEMSEKLFAHQPDFQTDKLKAYAAEIGLDADTFSKDLDSDAVLQKVLNDRSDGGKAMVTATPTFFINGTKFAGVLPLDQFEAEIESRLK